MSLLSDQLPLVGPLDQTPESQAVAPTPTELLIRRCLDGDALAYTALYRQHSAYVYRLTYGLLRHREDAEEVLQDAFEYAFRRLDQYDPQKSAFKTWLYRITISRCRNKRRRKWLPTFSINQLWGETADEALEWQLADHSSPQPEEVAELTGQQKVVWLALGELSDKLRETAILRYYGGLSYQEIGDILHISPKTAESRMRLAHKALRRLLESEVVDT